MTETYNPILGRQWISMRNMFEAAPQDVAYVYMQNGLLSDRPGLRKVLSNTLRYDVDTSVHTIGFECVLPSNHDAVEFRADAQLNCSVSDPAAIVQHKITDACAAIQPALTRLMRLTSRTFDVSMQNRAQAEDAIARALLRQPSWRGFTISDVMVRLGLDEEELNHQRKLLQVMRDIEYHTQEAELTGLRDQLYQQRNKQSIQFYNELVQSGAGNLVLMHLADHPEEARGIGQELVKLDKEDQNHWLEALMKLKGQSLVEDHDVEELRQYILQQLKTRPKHSQILEELLEREAGK